MKKIFSNNQQYASSPWLQAVSKKNHIPSFTQWACSLLLTTCSLPTFAQQDPLYAQYINNPLIINPAYTGYTNNFAASLSYREQWVGLEGGPQTINFNSQISLSDNRMGAGLIVFSDKIGNTKYNQFSATYAYRIAVSDKQTLSFGLQGGFANYQVDNASGNVNPYDADDPLFEGSISESSPTFGTGLILSSDRYFIGLSVPNLLKSTFENQGVQATIYNQHFYTLASYLFFIGERVRLRPSVLVKLVSGAPASVDLNVAFIFYENYQVGLLTRDFNTYGLFGQMIVSDTFRFGFVFEVPTSASVGSNYTTFELTAGIRFNALSFHQNKSLTSF
jgi:type IX secretion system PorP/SprF family membrane protein